MQDAYDVVEIILEIFGLMVVSNLPKVQKTQMYFNRGGDDSREM